MAILVTMSIAILCLIPLKGHPKIISNVDKIEHAFAYFVLTLFWLFSLPKTKKTQYLLLIICFFFGIVIEVLQETTTTYRTGDYLDVIANSTGIVFGYVAFKVFFKKNS